MATVTVTGQAAGTGAHGYVVTDTPATYHDGLYTASRIVVPSPASVLGDGTTGGIFVRLRMGWPKASPPAGGGGVVFAYDRANDAAPFDQIQVQWTSSSGFRFVIVANGTTRCTFAGGDPSFVAGDEFTVAVGWNATTGYLSINGAAWTTHARSAGAFSGTLDTLDFGLLGGAGSPLPIDSAILWAACFTSDPAAITTGQLAAVAALTGTNPSFATTGVAPSMVWPAVTADYQTPPVNTVAPVATGS